MTGTGTIGYLAAVLGTICWLPQVIKTWRSRAVDDLLWATNLLLFVTVALWLTYGLIKGDAPLILSNVVGVLCIGAIRVTKLRWGKR